MVKILQREKYAFILAINIGGPFNNFFIFIFFPPLFPLIGLFVLFNKFFLKTILKNSF